jgi:hypothetical protein
MPSLVDYDDEPEVKKIQDPPTSASSVSVGTQPAASGGGGTQTPALAKLEEEETGSDTPTILVRMTFQAGLQKNRTGEGAEEAL